MRAPGQPRPGGTINAINLAAKVVDGQRVVVPAGVTAAKGAVATSAAANKATEAATGGTTAPSSTAPARTSTKPAPRAAKVTPGGAGKASAAKSADASAPLLAALERRRAVVLLFWNRKASDDRAVRRAVGATAGRHGKALVKAVPISQVARYGAITRGVQVLQSPTTLVIAPDRKARAIVGLTTTAEIDKAVGGAFAAAK